MAETKGIFLTRHIGKTTYKVRVHLSETANETMEDKILRLKTYLEQAGFHDVQIRKKKSWLCITARK